MSSGISEPFILSDDLKRSGDVRWLRRNEVTLPIAGGGPPIGAQYVVLAADGTLTAERILTPDEVGVHGVDGGAGAAYTLSLKDDGVTNAKLANMAQSTLKGRAVGAGTGDPTDLTAAQATAVLDAMVGANGGAGTKGLVPAPAAGDAAAGKFLKADGTWVAPSGSSAAFDPKTLMELYDDFIGVHIETGVTGGLVGADTCWQESINAGSIVASQNTEPNHPGVVSVLSGAGANGWGWLEKQISVFRLGAALTFEAVLKVVALDNLGVDTARMVVGFGDTLSDKPANGVYFMYESGTSANWLRCTANASTRTETPTGTAVSTNWVRLRIEINAAGTSAEFFIDGTSVGTNTTNLTANGITIVFGSRKTLGGTTSRGFRVDYVHVKQIVSR